MKRKRVSDSKNDYQMFANPYIGLATMIFVTADFDLKRLGGEEVTYVDGDPISKQEIRNFFNSRWAAFLASSVGVDAVDMARYRARIV